MPIFGKPDAPISFEWPTEQHFREQLPADLELRGMVVKISAPNNEAFGSVQLKFSNGIESPAFNV